MAGVKNINKIYCELEFWISYFLTVIHIDFQYDFPSTDMLIFLSSKAKINLHDIRPSLMQRSYSMVNG